MPRRMEQGSERCPDRPPGSSRRPGGLSWNIAPVLPTFGAGAMPTNPLRPMCNILRISPSPRDFSTVGDFSLEWILPDWTILQPGRRSERSGCSPRKPTPLALTPKAESATSVVEIPRRKSQMRLRMRSLFLAMVIRTASVLPAFAADRGMCANDRGIGSGTQH
jgi:hypothetical protein